MRGKEDIGSMFNYDNDNTYFKTTELATWVFNEINEALKTSSEDDVLQQLQMYITLTDERFSYDHERIHAPENWDDEQGVMRYRQYLESQDQLSMQLAVVKYEELKKQNEGKTPIVISFGDHTLIGSQLEHSGIIQQAFDAIHVSNH